MAMLDVKNLSISFGGLKAVDDFSITIEKGQLYGLIGPNGAGKTTIFNLLTGVYKPDGGRILLDGKDITGHKAIQINQAGIARTFQNIRLFKELSVLDNVKVGLHNHHKYSTLSGILRLPSYYKVEKEMDERAMELLKVFDLDKEFDYKASNLPYGKQRKLEIARALATEPKLLLLDEPAAGMNPNETAELMDTIRAKGVNITEVTLHVGLGTFRPVQEDEIADHKMHSEWYSVSEETAKLIHDTKAAGHRVIAVGTTSCRTLEAVAAKYGEIKACSGNTDIFLYPGVKFNCIDGLITNFHLPESTLIMLVSALYGYEKTMAAYKVAVEQKYRFFSFGDAMFIRGGNDPEDKK